jgi:hypothetical protein
MADTTPTLRLVNSTFISAAHRVPEGGLYQPDRLAAEYPPNPVDAPAEMGEETVELRQVARRLVVALVAMIGLAVLNFALLRRFGADLPPVALLTLFGVIAGAAVLSLIDRSKPARVETSHAVDGCAVGACPGPRPVGELTRRAAAQRQTPRLTDGRS